MVVIFWHNNTRVSPNSRDVLKLRVGSKIHDPHPKHLLDMTQIELFRKILDDKVLTITISQRCFEKCKPWYVRINKERITCFLVKIMFNFITIIIYFNLYVVLDIVKTCLRNLI